MTNPSPIVRNFGQPILLRTVVFFVLWIVLTVGEPSDLAAGIFATIAAVWASLYLLLPRPVRLSLAALLRFILRFFRQSVPAGVDVAWRRLIRDFRCTRVMFVFHCGCPEVRRAMRFACWNACCTLASVMDTFVPDFNIVTP